MVMSSCSIEGPATTANLFCQNTKRHFSGLPNFFVDSPVWIIL
jgi:hypothetical protein